jgi:hypothetical protein
LIFISLFFNVFICCGECIQVNPATISSSQIGDLHKLIDWISRYEILLASMPELPVIQNYLSDNGLEAEITCAAASELPQLCKVFVNGTDGFDGVAAPVGEECEGIWSSYSRDPLSFQASGDSPCSVCAMQIWEEASSIYGAAANTVCSVLQVLMAEKIGSILRDVFKQISEFANSTDLTKDDATSAEAKKIYILLANDCAWYFERISELIDSCPNEDVKQQLDSAFDTPCDLIIQTGQVFLKRVAAIDMKDMKEYLVKVCMMIPL